MRKRIASAAVLAGLGLCVSLGCSAQAESPTQAPEGVAPQCATSGSTGTSQPGAEPAGAAQPNESSGVAPKQARIADKTGQLENAFDKQFQEGNVDEAALSRLISDVVQAFPEAAQAKVRLHIDAVFDTGQKVASQMPPEERSKAVTPPSNEQIGKAQQGQLAGWGWGSPYGFGGYGAFGFPGMYGYGTGLGYGGLGYGGIGYGTGLGYGGLGMGGWYW